MAEMPVVTVPVQASGTITTLAGGMFDAFKTSPVLLLIVLLNIAFCSVGGYYLLQVEHYRADDRAVLGNLLAKCITETVPIAYLEKERAR